MTTDPFDTWQPPADVVREAVWAVLAVDDLGLTRPEQVDVLSVVLSEFACRLVPEFLEASFDVLFPVVRELAYERVFQRVMFLNREN